MNKGVLNSYLKFGYSLDYKNSRYSVNLSRINKVAFCNWLEPELINEGVRRLELCFADLYQVDRTYLVPLSGGSDSRAILGLLLKYKRAAEIYTYTFGTPGTFDYDLGCFIAKKMGTNHLAIPLSEYRYEEAELIDIARRFEFQSPLLLHPPVWLLDKYFKGMTIISGANAGAVVGSFVPVSPAPSLEDAKNRFIRKGSYAKSERIHNCPDKEFAALMDFKAIDPEELTYDEQVYFHERSIKHLAPHVLIKGFEYRLPFINNCFMEFMLSIDNRHRWGKVLYKKILARLLPELFSLPLEGNYGLPLRARPLAVNVKRWRIRAHIEMYRRFPRVFPYTSPMINYFEFNRAFREKGDLKAIVHENLMDLKKRKLVDWIDIDHIWSRHQSFRANLADLILLLFSLEIHLKAGKMI